MLQPLLLDTGNVNPLSRRLVRSAGIVVILLGAISLVGWIFDIPLFKTIGSGWISTKANTAFCFILLGLSLTLADHSLASSRASALRVFLATLAFVLASTTLAQDLLGFDARIDEFFFLDDASGSAIGLPGRMSPATAVGLSLIALSLMTTRWELMSQCIAIGAIGFGGLAIVGLIYGVEPLDPFVTLASMSLVTGLGIVLTGTGALFLRPDVGLPAALLDSSTSGTQLRRLLPTALLVPIAIGAFGLAGREAGFWTARSEAAIAATATMAALLALFLVFYRSLREVEGARLRALRSLTESESRYRSTFKNALIGIAHLSSDGSWLRANERLCEILHYTEEELREQTYGSVSELEDLQVDAVQWEMLCRGEINDYGVERRFRSKNGEQVVAEVRLVREEDEAGELQYFTLVMQDITGRKISEGTLRVYQRALAATQNGISIADATRADLPLVYANPAFLEITGYEESEVIGRNCRFLNRKARDQSGLAELRDAIEEGVGCSVLLRNHRKDGSGFWNQLSISPVEDDDGKISHYVGIMSDATEQVQDRFDRERLLQEAETANEAKDRFLSVVSHELRSPLNAILAWSSILEDEAPNDTVARAATAIEAAVRSQTRLVDDLLDVSRIRGEKLEVCPVNMELSREVQTVIDQLSPIADERGIELSLSAPENPLTVHADPGRIVQIVRNLVDNALKFTPSQGQVRVILSEGPDAIRIEVRDTGAGLTPESAARIFDEFWQADTPGSAGAKGLGLGLAIVHYLVKRHGGQIEAKSDGLGQGTSIWVELPRNEPTATSTSTSTEPAQVAPSSASEVRAPKQGEAQEAAPAGTQTEAEEKPKKTENDLSGLEIVVVDDDHPTVEALALVLESHDCIVRRAYSVAGALRFFEGNAPDFLVSDIGLPNRSGMELMRAIRKMDGGVASILAIAVTGMADPETRAKIRRAGFNLCLGKPASPETIIGEISRLRELDHQKVPQRKLLLISDGTDPAADDQFISDLEEQGHQVRLFSTSQCSIEALRNEAPDFALFPLPITSASADVLADRVAKAGANSIALVEAEAEGTEELSHFDFVLEHPFVSEGLRRIFAFQETEN